MRIGTQTYFDNVGREMSRFQEQLGDLTVRMSSGKRLLKPSDDPAAALAVVRARTDLAAGESRKLALATGTRLCRATDAALSTVAGCLTDAIDAARAVADSTASDQGRAAVAAQIRSSSATIFTAANTQSGGRYLFGGYQDHAPPFEDTAGTISYVGDSGSIAVPVGASALCPVAYPGDRVFNFDTGSGRAVSGVNSDVFALMESLAAALETGNTDEAALYIDDLQALRTNVTQLRGQIGAAELRVDASYEAALDAEQECYEIIEDRESLDIATAITDYSTLETNYQALLSVVSRIAAMPSLFDLM